MPGLPQTSDVNKLLEQQHCWGHYFGSGFLFFMNTSFLICLGYISVGLLGIEPSLHKFLVETSTEVPRTSG